MATAIKEPERGDEIISSLHLEDFAEAQAEKQYAKIGELNDDLEN